jgi:hypothetical protein
LIIEKLRIHFDVVQEINTMERRTHIIITKDWDHLADKPQVGNEVIKLLNGKIQVEMEIYCVKDGTLVIMLASSVHSK